MKWTPNGAFRELNYSEDLPDTIDDLDRSDSQLMADAKAGDQAAIQIIWLRHIKISYCIIMKYNMPTSWVQDLVQESTSATPRAITHFDPKYGFKFSSYLGRVFENVMLNYCSMRMMPVTIPSLLWKSYLVYRAAYESTPDQILRLHWNDHDLFGLDILDFKNVRTLYAMIHYHKVPNDIVDSSLEPAGLERYEMIKIVNQFVSELPSTERHIIMYRFGIDGTPVMTLEEIGNEFNVTRQRIQQIQVVALDTIKAKLAKPNGEVPELGPKVVVTDFPHFGGKRRKAKLRTNQS